MLMDGLIPGEEKFKGVLVFPGTGLSIPRALEVEAEVIIK